MLYKAMKKSILIIIFILNIFLINKVFAYNLQTDYNIFSSNRIYADISPDSFVDLNEVSGFLPTNFLNNATYSIHFNYYTPDIYNSNTWIGIAENNGGTNINSKIENAFQDCVWFGIECEGGYDYSKDFYLTYIISDQDTHNGVNSYFYQFGWSTNEGVWYLVDSNLYFSTPLVGEQVTSPVEFSGNYYDNDFEADKILIFLVPREGGAGIDKIIDIDPTTFGSFSSSFTLDPGIYDWTARLYNSTTMEFGDWYPNILANSPYFEIGGIIGTGAVCNPFSGSVANLFLNTEFSLGDCIGGFFTALSTDIGNLFNPFFTGLETFFSWTWNIFLPEKVGELTEEFFDNIPENLISLNFFPFNIIGDLQASMIAGLTYIPNDTSANYTVSVPLLGSTLTILDLGTIQNFMGTTATNNIKGLLAIVLWISFFFMIYYTIFDEAIYLSMPIKNRM